MHTFSKLLRLRVVWQFRLHPYHIRVRCICNGTVDSGLAATLVSVVTLPRPCRVPVEVHIHTSQSFRNRSRLGIALALALFQELLDKLLFVYVYSSVDRISDGLMEELEMRFFGPGIFNGLELRAILASLLGCVHELTEGL
jgi:hypothetical protein